MLILIKYASENPGDSWKIEMANEEDSVVLLQNGVLWAISDDIDPYLEKTKIMALDTDFLARGYKAEDSKVPLISYDDLVTLIEKHPQTMG
jgi:tRNA 2-thiouridine synthesizing protein B